MLASARGISSSVTQSASAPSAPGTGHVSVSNRVGIRSTLAEAGDAGEDVVCGFGPDERLRVGVVLCNVGVDGRLQRGRAGEGAALETPAVEQRKPALDEVEPGRAGRREVQVEAGQS